MSYSELSLITVYPLACPYFSGSSWNLNDFLSNFELKNAEFLSFAIDLKRKWLLTRLSGKNYKEDNRERKREKSNKSSFTSDTKWCRINQCFRWKWMNLLWTNYTISLKFSRQVSIENNQWMLLLMPQY